MTVVSNTSPIINLASIGKLELLKQLYGKITIPSAVFKEITDYQQPGSTEVKNYDWIIKQDIKNTPLAVALQNNLDKGESEAITLAVDLNADLLLIDEKAGRLMASELNIKRIGVIGILKYAKISGSIQEIKPLLDDLIHTAGFWVDKALYDAVLKDNCEF